MKKVLLIHNIVSPCLIPVFNHLAKVKDIDFKIIFLASTDSNRAWNIPIKDIEFNYKILKNLHFYIQSKELPLYFHWGLWSELREFKPDIVCMCGYQFFAAIEALIYAKISRVPITLWAGSHLLSGHIKNCLTDFYKSFFIPKFSTYITYGTACREQLINYGANPDKIIVGCNTVDIKWFMKKSQEISEEQIKELKKSYCNKNILYVGEFVERKGVINLIKAFEKLNQNDIGLVLVGKGKEKDKYIKYININRIKNVFIENFVQKDEIVKYYRLADIFVLPSFNEVWGLVVNEAMACGLPVISSIFAGATRDLVKEGINGFSFDPYNIDDLANKIINLLNDDKKREQMGKSSIDIIRDITPAKYAQDILSAIEIV
jgi:glycosyltransferase involved in cell wall biosynthesis